MKPDELMARAAAIGIDLTHVPGGTPEWTAEDAAHACGGLGEKFYCAFAYRFAGDDSVYGKLYINLRFAVGRVARHERWPDKVSGRYYQARLVRLALFEDFCMTRAPKVWNAVRASDAWPDLIELPSAVWPKFLRPRYEHCRAFLDEWCGTAWSHVSRRIADEDPSEDAA